LDRYNYIQNSQRGFHKEDDATYSNVIYKTKRDAKQTGNQMKMILKLQTPVKESVLGNSSNDFHRQVLLGFMNEKRLLA
jgi:hypothetical protein